MPTRTALLPLAALALALLASACTESARETFAFESELAPTGLVRVQNLAGAVLLRNDPTATRVHGTVTVTASGFKERLDASDAARRVTLVESGDAARVELTVRLPPEIDRQRFDVTLDLFVPGAATVAVVAEAAPIVVDGLRVGPIENRDGPVELRQTFGDTVIRTDNAPVIVTTHDGPLDIRTTNGAIDVVDLLGSLRASTTRALVRADVIPPRGGEVVIATTDAPVELGLDYDFGATLVASTSPEYPIDVRRLDFRTTYAEPGYLEGVLFTGAGVVDVRTSFGHVSIFNRR